MLSAVNAAGRGSRERRGDRHERLRDDPLEHVDVELAAQRAGREVLALAVGVVVRAGRGVQPPGREVQGGLLDRCRGRALIERSFSGRDEPVAEVPEHMLRRRRASRADLVDVAPWVRQPAVGDVLAGEQQRQARDRRPQVKHRLRRRDAGRIAARRAVGSFAALVASACSRRPGESGSGADDPST